MGTCVFQGYIDVPMFKIGYDVAANDSISHPFRFSINSQVPFVARAQLTVGGDLDGLQSYVFNTDAPTHVVKAGPLVTPNYHDMIWNNGLIASRNSLTGLTTQAFLDRSITGDFVYTVQSTFAGPITIGLTEVQGPFVLPGPQGSLSGYFTGNITYQILSNGAFPHNATMAEESNFGSGTALLYEGDENSGGPDSWGFATWFGGNDPFLFNTEISSGVISGWTYLITTVNRPRVITNAAASNAAPTFGNTNGSLIFPVFDDVTFENAIQDTVNSEVTIYKNGWLAVLKIANVSAPGAQWALVVMNFEQTEYFILRINAQNADVTSIINNAGVIPSFKIDTDGTLWLMAGTGDGLIYNSFVASVSGFAPFYPMPTATFNLPCFNPCPDAIWE